MTDELVVNVRYSEADFVRGMSYAYQRKRSGMSMTVLMVLSGLAAYSFVYLYILNFDKDWDVGFFTQFVTIGAVTGVLLYALKGWAPLTDSRFSKFYDSSSLLKEEYRIVISETGFLSTSISLNSEVRWNAVTETTETGEDFYFFLGPDQPLFIPKRVFTTAQAATLREMANMYGPKPGS